MAPLAPLDPHLPPGVRSRQVEGVNGLSMHVLEAGFETAGRPALLLLHGFPELAYSWRRVMGPLAAAGYHVIAPDMRGYGRTSGWDGRYEADLTAFGSVNLVRDCVALIQALGVARTACVVGHDFGSPVAAHCGLIRPDLFPRVVLMSAPYEGPPPADPGSALSLGDLAAGLAVLDPPRKHYQLYYSGPEADRDMTRAPQGMAAFLRGYFHVKSADEAGNAPHPLTSWAAEELALLPDYYVMPMERTMAEVAAAHMPAAEQIAACDWLTESDLAVYAGEFSLTGFQGGLNWYRYATGGGNAADMRLFAGAAFDIPCLFISGASDWGTYQSPGVFERMQTACAGFAGAHLVPGAGHWVMQEQPRAVVKHILDFLAA